MAIRPRGVPAQRRAAAIEQRWLHHDDERAELAVLPCVTADSDAAISVIVAANVHRRRQRAVLRSPGNRFAQRVVHLEDAGPRTEACEAVRDPRNAADGPPASAVVAAWYRTIVTATAPTSSIRSTGVAVCTTPPSDCRCAINASVMACDPPRGMGQPTACAVAAITRPKDALKGWSGPRNECAAIPA